MCVQVGVCPVVRVAHGAHQETLEEYTDRLGVAATGVALLADRDQAGQTSEVQGDGPEGWQAVRACGEGVDGRQAAAAAERKHAERHQEQQAKENNDASHGRRSSVRRYYAYRYDIVWLAYGIPYAYRSETFSAGAQIVAKGEGAGWVGTT